MNKSELIKAVADSANLSKKDADAAVNAVLDVIQNTLSEGEKVQLVGFGTFEVRDRKAKEAVNPRDREGAKVQIPARKAPAFKAGRALKQAVDKENAAK